MFPFDFDFTDISKGFRSSILFMWSLIFLMPALLLSISENRSLVSQLVCTLVLLSGTIVTGWLSWLLLFNSFGCCWILSVDFVLLALCLGLLFFFVKTNNWFRLSSILSIQDSVWLIVASPTLSFGQMGEVNTHCMEDNCTASPMWFEVVTHTGAPVTGVPSVIGHAVICWGGCGPCYGCGGSVTGYVMLGATWSWATTWFGTPKLSSKLSNLTKWYLSHLRLYLRYLKYWQGSYLGWNT